MKKRKITAGCKVGLMYIQPPHKLGPIEATKFTEARAD